MNAKHIIIGTLAALAVAGAVAGCGGQASKSSASAAGSSSGAVTLRVGASPVPHEEILNFVKDKLAKEGVNLEIVTFNDYVTPNLSLNDGSLDANFMQHQPYLDEFNKQRGTDLVSVGKVHLEPMSVYSNKIKDLKDLPDGATVAIPNDPTNGGRALLVLQSAGLIKLRDGAPITATPEDIASNPKNLKFSELEPPQLPRSLSDADIAVINSNFALEAKLNPKDALFTESKNSPYANIIAVKKGNENNPAVQKLVKELNSQEVKDFINEKYKGAIVPAF